MIEPSGYKKNPYVMVKNILWYVKIYGEKQNI